MLGIVPVRVLWRCESSGGSAPGAAPTQDCSRGTFVEQVPALVAPGASSRAVTIEVIVVTGATTAEVESAHTGIKNIKRTGRGFTNAANYRTRILVASAARTVA